MKDQNNFYLHGFEGKGALWQILSSFYPDNGDLKYSCIRNQHPVFSGSQEKRKKIVYFCVFEILWQIS
jgi:hypothetical protein